MFSARHHWSASSSLWSTTRSCSPSLNDSSSGALALRENVVYTTQSLVWPRCLWRSAEKRWNGWRHYQKVGGASWWGVVTRYCETVVLTLKVVQTCYKLTSIFWVIFVLLLCPIIFCKNLSGCVSIFSCQEQWCSLVHKVFYHFQIPICYCTVKWSPANQSLFSSLISWYSEFHVDLLTTHLYLERWRRILAPQDSWQHLYCQNILHYEGRWRPCH